MKPNVKNEVPGGARSRKAETHSVPTILAAAKRLFLEAGYDRTSMDAIARDAGLARQTVYNCFQNKEAILQAVIEEHWGRCTAGHVFDDSRSDPALILHQVANGILSFVDGTGRIEFARLVIAEARNRPWIAADFDRHGKAPLFDAFVDYLRRATNDKTLDCKDPTLAAYQFLGMIQEPLIWPKVMGANAPGNLKAEDVVNEAVRVFMAAYSPKPVRLP
jgi:AcrR family transcriptional regulator